MENIFVERLWRSLKYQEVYLNAYATIAEVKTGIVTRSASTMKKRQHQSLGYRTLLQITRNTCGYVDDWLRRPPALPPLPEQARKAGNARFRPHALHAPQPTGELISMILKVGPLPSHRLDTLGTDLKIAQQHLRQNSAATP